MRGLDIKGVPSLTDKLRAVSGGPSTASSANSTSKAAVISASTSATSLDSDVFSRPADSPLTSPEVELQHGPRRPSTLAPQLRNLQTVAQKVPPARRPIDMGEPTPPHVPKPANRRLGLAAAGESSASGSELDSPARPRREHRLPLAPRAQPMPVDEARASLRLKLGRMFRDEDHERLFERLPPSQDGVTKLFLDHSNILLGLYKARRPDWKAC